MARSNRRSFWKSFTRNFFGFFSRERAGQITSPVTRRKIGLEQLETRWVPATVSWATGVLSIQTGPGETITASTSGNDLIAYTTSSTWIVDSSASTAGFNDNGGLLEGNLSSTSTGSVSILGNIAGSETLNIASGYSTTSSNLTAQTNLESVNLLGSVSINGLSLDTTAISLGGNITAATLAITSAGAISSTSKLTVTGTATLQAGANNITLSNISNDFGTVNITSGNVTTLRDSGALILGTGTTTTLNVTTSGDITQSGALTVSGTTTLNPGSANNITLSDAGNNFGTVNISSANVATLRDTNALIMGTSTATTLDVTTNGTLSQSGALTVSGTSTLTAGALNSIQFDNSSNNNFGTVIISATRNASFYDKNAIVMGTTTLINALDLNVAGQITQTGVLTIGGQSYINANNNNITLTNPANNFGNFRIFNAPVVSITDTNAVSLTVVQGVGTLNATAGGNIIALDGPISVSQALNISAIGFNVTMNTQNAGGNSISGVINVTAQNLALSNNGSTVLGNITLSGTMEVGPAGGGSNMNISQSGPISVAGNASFTANTGKSIDLSTQTNSFGGTLTFGGALLDLGLKTNSAIALAAATLTGNLTATTSAGDITQTGALVVPGTTTLSAGTNNITLSNAGNNFGTVKISSGNVATLNDSGDIILGTSSATTLNVTAAGNITQSGAITTTGNATFTVGSGNGIDLSTSANTFGGVLTFGASSGSLSFLGLNTNTAIGLAAMNLSGNLTAITSGGDITQTGAIVVGGTTKLSAGSNNITLSDAGNNFGTVNITSANVATLQDSNDLVLGTSTATTLNVTAAGNITQSGAITTTGNATITVGNGKGIDLSTSANTFGGVLTFGASSGGLSFLGLNTNTAIALAGINLSGYLTAITSAGTITQTGAIVVGGTTTLSAGSNNITLSDAGNNFGTVNITSANVATLQDSNDLVLGTSTATTLNVTAAGNITQSGAITTTGNATITVGNGKGIDLSTSANTFGGVLTFGASSGGLSFLGLNTNTAIALAGINLSGYLTAITSAGDITQTGALVVGGTTTLSAGGNNITLSNTSNDFGTVNITSGNVTTLVDSNALILGTGTTTTLNVTTGGAITQTGALTVSGTTAIAAGSANNITLSNASNNFGTVNITSANVATLQDTNDLVLGTSALTTLNVTAAGNVTQSGAITTTGDATFTVGSGTGIDLSTSTNSFGGVLTFGASSGSLSFLGLNTNTAIALAGINLSGYLTAITTAGDITQTGALVVAGTTTLSAGTNNITLSNVSNNFGTVNITSANVATLVDAGAIDLGTSSVTTLAVTAGGAITDSGALTVTGTTTLTAGSNNITLNSGANNFGTVNITSANVTTLVDATALVLGTTTTTTLDVTAGGALSQTGAITVTGNASFTAGSGQGIDLSTSTNSFGGVLTFGASSGSLAFLGLNTNTNIDFSALTLSGYLTAITSGGNITQTGALVVGGATKLSAGTNNITLSDAGNDFGTVNITSGNVATLVDATALILGTTTATTLNVTAGGTITQTGGLTVSGTTTLDAGSNNITLSNASNNFGTVNITSGNVTTLLDSGALVLGIGTTTTLDVTAGGDITQTGALTVSGTTTIAAGSANNITLDGNANDFGTVNITSANVATLQDTNNLVLGTSSATTLNVTTAGNITQSGAITTTGDATFTVGSGQGIDLSTSTNSFGGVLTFGASSGSLSFLGLNTNTAIALAGINLSGYLTAITTAGDITQTGALVVAGTTTLSAGTNNITLNNASNNFGTVNITSGNVTSLVDTGALVLGTTTSTTLNVTAGGAITQTGALTVSGTTTLTAGSNNITLSNASNDFGTVNIASGNVVALRDSGALVLGTGITTTLDVTTGGALSQTGALTVSGTTTIAAGSGNNITLDNAGNDFGTVNITSGNVTTVRDSGALVLGTGTTTSLNVTAAGAITQTGALTVSGTTTIAAGSANNITLSNAGNNFGTVVISSGNVATLVDSTAIELGNITTAGGASVTAVGITQASGATLNAGSGTITLNGGGGNITAQGTITTTSSSVTALQVQSGNVVSLGVVNVASGTVALSSITGSASFTGNLTAGGLTVPAGAYDVSLTGATNNITAFAVNFQNTGNLTLGDSATDSTTFGQAFSSGTQANIFLAGQILTGNDLYLGGAQSPITLVANTTVGLSPSTQWKEILLYSKVDGAYSMGIFTDYGYGLNQPIGSTTPLTSFQFNGSNGSITANVTTNGPQTYNYLGIVQGTFNTNANGGNGAFSSVSMFSLNGDTVITTGSGNISLPEISGAYALSTTTTGTTTLGGPIGATPLGNLNITTGTALALPTTTLDTGKNLIVVAGGAITQSGALTVPGTTSLTAGSANPITLANATNDFTGAVTVVSGSALSLADANTLKLGGFSGNGVLVLSAPTLNITGALSTTNGNATLTTNNLVLGSTLNAGTGTVTIGTSTNSYLIDLGGASGASTLGISTADQGNITAAGLVVGSGSNTGGITLSQPFATVVGRFSDLTLASTGNISLGVNINTTATNGNFTANGPVLLTGAVTIGTGTGNLSLAGKVDGAYALNLQSTGNTTLGGVVGGTTKLASLTTDAPGTTNLNGGVITTTGTQTFNDNVLLGANTTLTASTATFASSGSLDGQAHSLTVNGNLALDGTVTNVSSITVNGGSTAISTNVTTVGDQIYPGAITISANVVLTAGGDIAFQSTLNSQSTTPYNLTLDATGNVTFSGQVGYINRLNNINIANGNVVTVGNNLLANSFTSNSSSFTSAGKTINTSRAGFNGGAVSITTSGALTTGTIGTAGGAQSSQYEDGYNAGAVTLNGTTLTVGTITATGSSAFDSDNGGSGGQVSITATTVNLTGNITTSGGAGFNGQSSGGDVSVSGTLTLPGNRRISTGAGAGNILLSGVTGNNYGLQLVSGAGSTTVSGAVTGVGALTLQENALTSTGAVSFTGNVSATSLVTYASSYDVSFKGQSTAITSATTFRNTGALTLGDSGSSVDTLAFTGGLVATAPSSITTGGSIETVNTPLTLGAFTASTDTALGAGTGTVTVGPAIIGSGATLTLGLGGASTILAGTITGSSKTTSNLVFNTTGSATVSGAADTLNNITVTNSGGLTFQNTVTAGNVSVVSTAAGATVAIQGNLNLMGDLTGAGSNAYTLALAGALNTIGGAGSFTATGGTLAINDQATDSTVFTGGLVNTLGSTNLIGSVSTVGTSSLNLSAVTLVGGARVVTANGPLTLGTIAGGSNSLGLTSNGSAGDIRVTGAAGNLGIVTVSAGSGVNASFESSLSANSLVTAAANFNMRLLGTATIGGATVFNNTGITTLNGGTLTFQGGVTATAGALNLGGTIATLNAGATFGDSTLLGATIINTGTGTGSINFQGLLDGAQTLSLVAGAGPVNFGGIVGGVNRLGAVTIASAKDVSLAGAFSAASLTQSAGTGITSISGPLDTSALAGVNLTTYGISVDASVSTAASSLGIVRLNAGAGGMTITALGDINSDGAVSLFAAGPGITSAGDITTNDANVLVQNKFMMDGSVSISTGGTGAGDITFGNTINGESDLALNAGTGDIRLRYVGTLAVPNSISIASARDVIGYYLMKVGSFTQTAGSGTTSIRGLTTDTNLGVNIKASAISILNRPVTTLESGPVTLNATSGMLNLSAGGDITSTGAVTLTGAGGINAQGTVATTADDITFVSATTLTDALTVRSTGIAGVGNISFQGGITGASKALVVSSQEGSIAFNGNSTGIGALTLQENSVLASGPVTFNGNLSATSINTYAQDYAVSFLGATTAVTNALTLKNTGLVTLGDQPSDSLVFTGGLVHTAGNTTLNGAVATTNAAVTLNTVSLGGNSSINAGTGNISFMKKVDGSADLTLTGGAIQFTEEVGGTTPLGQLTIASATDLTFEKSVDAAGLQQILGSGTTTLKGEVTTTSGAGVNLAANLVSVQAAVDAGNNPVVLSADNLNITAAVSSGTANTTLTGYSAATVVDLGGKDTAGIVGISQAEQALITAGTLVVGTASNTGGVTVSQSVTTGTFGNLSLRSGGVIAVNAAITTTATSGLVTANTTGNLNIAAAGVITSGGAVSLSGSAINTAGNISTTNDAVSFNSPTTLTGAVAVNTGTGAGDILFASTLAGGSKNLTLVSGSGATTLQGSASGLGTLTIQEDASTSTGAFAAQGNLAAATVNTFGRNYDVAFTGDTTAITNPLNLLNTGKATLGNGALDTFTLAGLTHTAGNTALRGVFTLTGNLTLNSTALDGDTTIGLGVNDAVFNQTVDGPGALDITGRDVLFSGIVGGTSPLVSLTLTDAKTTLAGNVTTIGAQAYNGNLVLGGDVKLATTNSKVTVNGTLNGTTAGQQALTVAAGTGYITLGGVVGGTAALKQLDATGGTTLLAGDVTTTGTQTYNGNLVLTGDVKLATTNSAVNIGGQVNGTNAGLESLTIATGTANVTLSDTVGSTKALEQLAITANLTSLANNVTTAGTQNFNGAVLLTGNATLTTTNSNVTVTGTVNAIANYGQSLAIRAGSGTVTLGGPVGAVYGMELYGLDITAGNASLSSVTTGPGGQTYTASTTLNGAYFSQNGGAIAFNGPVILAGNSTVRHGSGPITLASTLNGGGYNLDLNSGVSVTITGAASNLGTLDLNGPVSILGNLTANTLVVGANNMSVSLTGTNVTIANPVNLVNTGLVTLGDASSDSFTFNGGLTHTAGATYLAGSIVTSGDKVELGNTTLANNGSITTAGGDIVLGGTVDGLSAGAQGLTLTAAGGNISIAGKVGDTNALGAILIASANNTTFSSTVKSAGVTQTAGTGTTTFTGNLTTSGVAGVNINAVGIAVNGQVATTGNGIVRLNAGATGLSMMGGYIDADGAVSLFSSAASGISFTGTVRTTSDNVLFQNKLTVPGNLTVNTTVAGSGANITFGNAMTFTASATLDLTAGTGNIQLRRMDTSAGTSAVVINSVRNLSATQAMNIGSFQQVAGSGNTTFAGTGSLTATAAAGVNITTSGAFSTVQPITATTGGVLVMAGTTVTLGTASVVSAAGAVALVGPTGVSLGANLTATNSNLTVIGAATLTGNVTVTAGTGNVGFSSTINGARALSVNASGLTSFLDSVGNTTRLTSLATNAGGTTRLDGAVVQTNGPINIQDAVLLGGSTVISSNGAAITLNSTIDGTKSGLLSLGLTAGSGNITVGGAVGGTTALGAITVNSANVTSFASGVKAVSLTQVAGGSTSLLGAVTTTDVAGVNITANTVSVASNITTTGGGVVTLNSAASLLNLTAMGGITADGAVSLTGSAGIDVGGAITTTNDAVSFSGATRLTSPLTVDTGAGAGNITFSAGVNGSVAGAQGLTLTAGTGDISTGTIGGTTGLGAVTINSARNLSVLDVKATSLTQLASSGTSLYTGNITTTGGAGVNLSGNLVSVGSITSANNPIALYSDRISMNGSVDAGNSSVTLGASSNGTIIDLGGPDVTGTTLGLTNAELSKVTAANLIIGSAANTGGIRVTDSISIASKAMSLTTGSNITFATNGALTGNLSSTEITLNTGLSGGVVGASDTAVDVVANALTVNGGSGGIGANATPLRTRVNTLVTDTNDASDGDQYLAQDPTVNLTVGQGDLDAGSATITLKGGKFYTISGGDILSALTIGAGASAGGTGTIQAVTVLDGGNLMPGAMTNPRVGILNTGAVTLTSNGNLNVFAAPANTATGPQPSGVIASSGAVDLGDANLYLTFAQANLRPGQTFEIITGTSVTGTLKVGGLTLFDGDIFEAGSYLFQINYTATSVVITALGVV